VLTHEKDQKSHVAVPLMYKSLVQTMSFAASAIVAGLRITKVLSYYH
jgi:hypothetical protein